MMEDTLFAIWFTAGFLLLLVWLPAKVMGWKLTDRENGGEYAIKALVISHLVLINGVYLLSFLHVYKTSFLILYLIVVLFVAWRLKGHKVKSTVEEAVDWLYHVAKGHYKISIYMRRFRIDGLRHIRNGIREMIRRFFSKEMLSYVILWGSLIVLIYRRFQLVFSNYAYLTADMYVHGDWINYLEQDQIFYDGVYPYGMHNMISSFHKLTGLQLNIVNRYWGPFLSILMILVLYWFLKKTLRNQALAVIPVVIYCISDFVNNDYGYRFAYTLGQETCMVFLLPMIFFMGRFIIKKQKKDALYFSLSAGLIVAIHFYTAIMAVLLCLGICVAFLKELLNWKMIRMMLLQVVLIAVVGLTPLMVGLMQGRYWQGSTSWALSVVQGKDEEFKRNNNSAEKNGMSTNEQVESSEDTATDEVQEQPSRGFVGTLVYGCQQTVLKQVEDMAEGWGIAFWVCMAFLFLYEMWRYFVKRKVSWADRMQLALGVYLLLCTVVYAAWAFGLPTLMQELRVRMFLGYFVPAVFVVPFDVCFQILQRIRRMKNKKEWIVRVCAYAGSVAFAIRAYGMGVSYQTYFYLEPTLAAKACVDIEYTYPKNTWTIVSPVDEIAMIRGHGYHYELWDFITGMERYRETMETIIPTKYVFFVVEKRPINYNQYRLSTQEYEDPEITLYDANQIATKEIMHVSDGGEMKFYANYENRRILEAKLYQWIQAYQEIYPDQFEVYQEDDTCIIYKFTQNELSWNNLAIPYSFNEIPDDRYQRVLRKSNIEYEKTHPNQ